MAAANLPTSPGAYVLILHLPASKTIQVGRLGRFDFPAGFYAYVGSALGPGGLAGRLGRHLRRAAAGDVPGAARRPHWHVDYLLGQARLVQVWLAVSDRRLEHDWAGQMAAMPGAAVIAPGFGASDCRCLAHLFHFRRPPDLDAFRRLAGTPLAVALSAPPIAPDPS